MPWKSNELLGAAQKLLDILDNSADAALIAAGGLTVATPKTALTTKKTTYSTKEHDQEEALEASRQAGLAEQAAGQGLYDTIASVCEASAGAVGKKTALGRRILAIRTQLNRSKKKPKGSGSGSGSGSDSGSSSDSGSGSGS